MSIDPLGFLTEPPPPTVTTKPSLDVTHKPPDVTAKPSPGVTTKPSPEVTHKPPDVTAKPSPGVTTKPSPEVTHKPPDVTAKPSPGVTTKPSAEVTHKPPDVAAKPSPPVTHKPGATDTERKAGSAPKVESKGPPAVASKPAKEPSQTYAAGDSSDDDLFQDALATSFKQESPKVTPKPLHAKIPVEQRKSLEDSLTIHSPTSPKKKPIGGVSLFGGVDIFAGFGKKEDGLFGDSPTSPTKEPPAIVPKPTKVGGTHADEYLQRHIQYVRTHTHTHAHTHTRAHTHNHYLSTSSDPNSITGMKPGSGPVDDTAPTTHTHTKGAP